MTNPTKWSVRPAKTIFIVFVSYELIISHRTYCEDRTDWSDAREDDLSLCLVHRSVAGLNVMCSHI